MVPINCFAVVVAAIVNMVLGSLWYGPIFGKQWMTLMGKDMNNMSKDGMGKKYVIAGIGSLLIAFVLAHSIIFATTYLHIGGISAAFQAAFWNWLGFIAPVTVGMVLWEGKSWKLWMILNGYYLLSLFLMSSILMYWA